MLYSRSLALAWFPLDGLAASPPAAYNSLFDRFAGTSGDTQLQLYSANVPGTLLCAAKLVSYSYRRDYFCQLPTMASFRLDQGSSGYLRLSELANYGSSLGAEAFVIY